MMSHADNYLLDAAARGVLRRRHRALLRGGARARARARVPARDPQRALAGVPRRGGGRRGGRGGGHAPSADRARAAAAALCAGVEPGGAALLECLQLKAAHPEMDGACAAQMTRYAKRASRHMAFNTMVKKHCPADAERLCSGEASGETSTASKSARRSADAAEAARHAAGAKEAAGRDPLSCLVGKVESIDSEACVGAVRRSVLRAFKAFRAGHGGGGVRRAAERLCGDDQDARLPGARARCCLACSATPRPWATRAGAPSRRRWRMATCGAARPRWARRTRASWWTTSRRRCARPCWRR